MDAENLTTTFLLESIRDIQGTIRAIDGKIAAYLIVLVIPLTTLDKIATGVAQLYSWGSPVMSVGVIIAALGGALCWTTGLLAAVLALCRISDPTSHIFGTTPSGKFYNKRLFPIRFADSFFNRRFLSDQPFETMFERLRITSSLELVQELGFEQVKLCFIRDLKARRQVTAFLFGTVSILMGSVLWVASILETSHCA